MPPSHPHQQLLSPEVTQELPGAVMSRLAGSSWERAGRLGYPRPLPPVSLPTVPSLAQPLLGHGGTQGVVKAELPASDVSHRILQVPAGLRVWSPPARVAPAVV